MPDSISTVVAHVRQRLPDLTGSRAIELANIVHRELFAFVPEVRRTPHGSPVVVPVSAGVKEYAIPEELTQLDYVHLDGKRLYETNVETLNKTQPSWRVQPNSSPQQFYITAHTDGKAAVGLHPTPNASGNLTLYGSQREPSPLTGTSLVPESLPNAQVYVEGVSYYAALELRPSSAPMYKANYAEQLAILRSYVDTRNEGLKKAPFPNERSKP